MTLPGNIYEMAVAIATAGLMAISGWMVGIQSRVSVLESEFASHTALEAHPNTRQRQIDKLQSSFDAHLLAPAHENAEAQLVKLTALQAAQAAELRAIQSTLNRIMDYLERSEGRQ